MRISVIHTDTNGGFILMLQVLLILLETRTSIVLYTDMNTDIGANINIAKKCTSLIQMESTGAYVCTHIFILILVQALVSVGSSICIRLVHLRLPEKLEHCTRTIV